MDNSADSDSFDCEFTKEERELLHELPDGAGCVEIWDHLSEIRGND